MLYKLPFRFAKTHKTLKNCIKHKFYWFPFKSCLPQNALVAPSYIQARQSFTKFCVLQGFYTRHYNLQAFQLGRQAQIRSLIIWDFDWKKSLSNELSMHWSLCPMSLRCDKISFSLVLLDMTNFLWYYRSSQFLRVNVCQMGSLPECQKNSASATWWRDIQPFLRSFSEINIHGTKVSG